MEALRFRAFIREEPLVLSGWLSLISVGFCPERRQMRSEKRRKKVVPNHSGNAGFFGLKTSS
jgi:hypothetical protein